MTVGRDEQQSVFLASPNFIGLKRSICDEYLEANLSAGTLTLHQDCSASAFYRHIRTHQRNLVTTAGAITCRFAVRNRPNSVSSPLQSCNTVRACLQGHLTCMSAAHPIPSDS